MALRRILTVPDPILRERSSHVEKVDSDIKSLMDDMLETMYEAPGIGLAAIQIGVSKRVVVMDVSKDEGKKIQCILLTQRLFGNQVPMLVTRKDVCRYQISL